MLWAQWWTTNDIWWAEWEISPVNESKIKELAKTELCIRFRRSVVGGPQVRHRLMANCRSEFTCSPYLVRKNLVIKHKTQCTFSAIRGFFFFQTKCFPFQQHMAAVGRQFWFYHLGGACGVIWMGVCLRQQRIGIYAFEGNLYVVCH